MIVVDKEFLDGEKSPQDLFALLAQASGGLRPASDQLGISAPYLSQLRKGARSCSPGLAERFERVTGGRIKKEWFLWGKPA